MGRYRDHVFVLALSAAIAPHPISSTSRAQDAPARTGSSEASVVVTPDPAASAEPEKPGLQADAFIQRTAPLLKLAEVDVLLRLGAELQAGGHGAAARMVFESMPTESMPTGPAEDALLVRRLIWAGQTGAALELLRAWRRRTPGDPQVIVLTALAHVASGQNELALRELLGLRGIDDDDESAPLAALLRRLLQMQQRGIVPGTEVNPWGVRFVDESGDYVPGAIAAAEAAKITPSLAEAAETMKQLIEIVPKQGNLWALIGELFNASGEPLVALVCFRRAEELRYTNRTLRDHRRALEAYKKEQERSLDEALDQAMVGGRTDSRPDAATPAGWDNLTARPAVLAVVLAFAAFIVLVAALQIREWTKGRRS